MAEQAAWMVEACLVVEDTLRKMKKTSGGKLTFGNNKPIRLKAAVDELRASVKALESKKGVGGE